MNGIKNHWKKGVILVLLFFIGTATYRYFSKPSHSYIEQIVADNTSLIATKKDYKQQVANDTRADRDFFFADNISYAMYYSNTFPYERKRIDLSTTNIILDILNDSANYEWGEFGTPEYSSELIYYDKNDVPLGYSAIDLLGEFDSYPYRSLMKWGKLVDKEFEKIMFLLK